MADPVTAGTAAVGMGANIFSSILGARSAASSGAAARNMSNYQAGMALLNAQIARQNADYASIQGEKLATKYGLSARQQAGGIVAAQSASGLDVTSGSAKEVQDSQRVVSQMDMDQIRQNAAKTAYDYRVTASNLEAEARMAQMAGEKVAAASRTTAFSSLVGGAESVASKWLEAKKYGVFNFNVGT